MGERLKGFLRPSDQATSDAIQSETFIRDRFAEKQICPAIVDVLLGFSQYLDEASLVKLRQHFFSGLTEEQLDDFSVAIAQGSFPHTFSYSKIESAAVFGRLLYDPNFTALCYEIDMVLNCEDENYCPIGKVHKGIYKELKRGKSPKEKRKLNSTS